MTGPVPAVSPHRSVKFNHEFRLTGPTPPRQAARNRNQPTVANRHQMANATRDFVIFAQRFIHAVHSRGAISGAAGGVTARALPPIRKAIATPTHGAVSLWPRPRHEAALNIRSLGSGSSLPSR